MRYRDEGTTEHEQIEVKSRTISQDVLIEDTDVQISDFLKLKDYNTVEQHLFFEQSLSNSITATLADINLPSDSAVLLSPRSKRRVSTKHERSAHDASRVNSI